MLQGSSFTLGIAIIEIRKAGAVMQGSSVAGMRDSRSEVVFRATRNGSGESIMRRRRCSHETLRFLTVVLILVVVKTAILI